MIQGLLDRHVATGEIAGAVALVADGNTVSVAASGWQDLAAKTPMRRDTIFQRQLRLGRWLRNEHDDRSASG